MFEHTIGGRSSQHVIELTVGGVGIASRKIACVEFDCVRHTGEIEGRCAAGACVSLFDGGAGSRLTNRGRIVNRRHRQGKGRCVATVGAGKTESIPVGVGQVICRLCAVADIDHFSACNLRRGECIVGCVAADQGHAVKIERAMCRIGGQFEPISAAARIKLATVQRNKRSFRDQAVQCPANIAGNDSRSRVDVEGTVGRAVGRRGDGLMVIDRESKAVLRIAGHIAVVGQHVVAGASQIGLGERAANAQDAAVQQQGTQRGQGIDRIGSQA